jgi:hypothetical protein
MLNMELGYTLHPPRRHSEPGYSGLDVILECVPTGRHFDPQRMRLGIADETGGICMVMLGHPWIGGCHQRACAGPVDVFGYGDKRLEVFTFGGDIVIKPCDECTLITLNSDAPILVRVSTYSTASLFMEEAEALLAMRRGAWGHDPEAFDHRLALAQPLELYHASADVILGRLKALPVTEGDIEERLMSQLRAELRETIGRKLEEVL